MALSPLNLYKIYFRKMNQLSGPSHIAGIFESRLVCKKYVRAGLYKIV